MILDFAYKYFDEPMILLLIIPLFFALLFLIRKDFVKFADEDGHGTKKFWFFLMRFTIFSLLIAAIASPFTFQERLVSGEPNVIVLVDNSTSFDLFDRGIGETIKNELKSYVKTDLRSIGTGERSDLGDRVLENMRRGGSVILISDGYNNEGVELGDVALHATNLNASINAVDLKPIKDDYRVEIRGPSKVIADVDNIFVVNVDGTSDREHRVTVTVDGKNIIEKTTNDEIKFVQKFSDGYHKITAQIYDQDYFSQNNFYYKTVKVVKKPRVLLVTQKDSPLSTLVRDIYEVEITNDLGRDLKPHYMVILNDLPIGMIDEYSVALSDYVGDGNGLVVFGGAASYDRSEYKGSAFERMLPVFVSGAGKTEGDINVVIAIDISESTGGGAVDVEKSLAISALRNIKKDSRVGVVAFDTQGRVVSDLKTFRGVNQQDLESKISALASGGGTLIGAGMLRAYDMLAKAGGSKNVILISDGMTQGRSAAYSASQNAASAGIKIFTLGVGETTNERVMQDIAEIGSGSYFRAEEARNIKILFGDPDEEEKGKNTAVMLIDRNHFITQDLELQNPNVYGYNEVVPKSTAKLLAATMGGNPLLSVWRFGLGRVASVSTDDGSSYAGELLSRDNSGILVRTMNWGIGDPERKNERYIDIQDTRVRQNAEIVYKTDRQPTAEDVAFYKVGENLYSGSLYMDGVGFKSLLGADFAVNYPEEYHGVGLGPDLNALVQSTGGKMFDPKDIEGMVEAVREQSKRTSFQKRHFRWPFVLIALILFLFDIFARKMAKYKNT